MSKTTQPVTSAYRIKRYRCAKCGHEKDIGTNHFGECYSLGSYNRCPKCGPLPPDKRFPQLVTYPVTVWQCAEPVPEGMGTPAPWKQTTLGEICKIRKTTTYYATPALFGAHGFELRQTRFIGNEQHPHDVCAVAMSVQQLRETVAILKGSIDWTRVSDSQLNQRTTMNRE